MLRAAKPKKGTSLVVPEVFRPLWMAPRRRNYLLGGRGSGKSHDVAEFCLARARAKKTKVLCTRELQKSIAESVHALLCDKIRAMGLEDFFTVYKDRIVGANGSLFIFAGIRQNVGEIKSMEGIDICWVEEAQSMSRQSIDVLVPTIRAEGSIIIFTFNPFKDTDPVYVDAMMAKESGDPNALVITANYMDNPFFPEVLRLEMERDKEADYEKYLWVWEGQCLGLSDAQIFRGKYEVREFDTPANAELRFGADWGFGSDPTVLIRSFVVGNTLYIDQCAGRVGCDIVDTPTLFSEVDGSSVYPIYGDSARPETISHMNNHGFNVVAADKWAGSVEDGIQYLRSFTKIVIHPRCEAVIEEFDLYQYKVDRQTNEVLREPVDKFNHYIDALRYSYTPVMRGENNGKAYDRFDADCIEASPSSLPGTVFLGTLAMPGKVLWVAASPWGGSIHCLDSFQQGMVDFKKVRAMFPRSELVWMPFAKLGEVQQNFVEDAEDADIEPAVPGVLPPEGEARKLCNDLFERRGLKVCETANRLIACLNERVFLPDGKSEKGTKERENDRICRLFEYLVWRIWGRLQYE